MALRAFRGILKLRKSFLSLRGPPLVKSLTADGKLSTYLAYIAYPLIPLKPGLSYPGSSLYDILVHVGDLLCLRILDAMPFPYPTRVVTHQGLSRPHPIPSLYPGVYRV